MSPGPAHTRPAAGVCLVLMLKAPARSKRRLAGQIGELAYNAAEHLWACAHEDVAEWAGPVCFAPASESDSAWLDPRIGRDALVLIQPDGNLGERINHVNRRLHSRSLEKQIFIGIDCPALNSGYVERAARLLDGHDAVLGPARDGGVVLMAAKRPWPALDSLPWSSADLMTALEGLLRAEDWTVARLATLADIDSLDDLAAAAPALKRDPRPARRAFGRWIEEQRLTSAERR
jgi:glycosyltransferase A (GT-A) superfamily protein (DUF2064 family)